MTGDWGEGVSVGSGIRDDASKGSSASSAECPAAAGEEVDDEGLLPPEDVNENRTLGAPNLEAISRTEGISRDAKQR